MHTFCAMSLKVLSNSHLEVISCAAAAWKALTSMISNDVLCVDFWQPFTSRGTAEAVTSDSPIRKTVATALGLIPVLQVGSIDHFPGPGRSASPTVWLQELNGLLSQATSVPAGGWPWMNSSSLLIHLELVYATLLLALCWPAHSLTEMFHTSSCSAVCFADLHMLQYIVDS